MPGKRWKPTVKTFHILLYHEFRNSKFNAYFFGKTMLRGELGFMLLTPIMLGNNLC